MGVCFSQINKPSIQSAFSTSTHNGFFYRAKRKRSPSFKTVELTEASADDIYRNLYISGYHRKLVLLIVLLDIVLEKITTNAPSLETHSLMLLFKIMYCAQLD